MKSKLAACWALFILLGTWNTDIYAQAGHWQVLHWEKGKDKTLVENQGLSLELSDKGQFSLYLDVNRCSGKYEQVEKRKRKTFLVFAEMLTCTKKCCDSPEAQALAAMLKGDWEVLSRSEQELRLQGPDKTLLVCGPAPKPKNPEAQALSPQEIAANLPNSTWAVVEFLDREEGTVVQFTGTMPRAMVEFRENSLNIVLEKQSCKTDYRFEEGKLIFPDRRPVCEGPCCDTDLYKDIMQQFSGQVLLRMDEQRLVLLAREKTLYLEMLPK